MPSVDDRGRAAAATGGDAPAPEAAAEVLAALSAAVRAVTLGSTLDRVLAELAARARDLVGARYAAIGIPEPDSDEFAQFITVGMSDELIAELGPLPRTHGLLDAMLVDPSPYRTPDITEDPRFRGWWPDAHPEMRSFLGVPIVSAGDIVGAFYLTDKEDGPDFTAADEDAIVLLSSHAAIAIDQARLFEDSRELALVQERARLARELHDAMSQSLFSLQLAAETATRLLEDDPAGAADQLGVVRTLSARLAGELRGTVEGLRPADLERDGLAAALRDHLLVAARAHEMPLELDIAELPELDPAAEHQVLRVAQEAVTNALRHAGPCRVQVMLRAESRRGPAGADEPAHAAGPRRPGSGDGDRTDSTAGTATGPMEIVLQVVDDGTGFDPDARGVRARRLGLTSMHERAASLGGALTVTSSPGNGTSVELRFPA